MKLTWRVTAPVALVGLLAVTACGPSFTEQVYDQDMCELRANALCRQDSECANSQSPLWRQYVIECMREQGYSEEEVEIND